MRFILCAERIQAQKKHPKAASAKNSATFERLSGTKGTRHSQVPTRIRIPQDNRWQQSKTNIVATVQMCCHPAHNAGRLLTAAERRGSPSFEPLKPPTRGVHQQQILGIPSKLPFLPAWSKWPMKYCSSSLLIEILGHLGIS